MTTQLNMTTQLTTPTTATISDVATRKAAKDPADQAADQFAAMFASLCFAPLPQPQPTPSAKPQEEAPVSSIANPEIAGAELASGAGKEASETLANSASLPLGLSATTDVEAASAPVWLFQIPTLSSQRQETASPSASAQVVTETIPPALILPQVAKPQETVRASGMVSLENAASLNTPAPPIPVTGTAPTAYTAIPLTPYTGIPLSPYTGIPLTPSTASVTTPSTATVTTPSTASVTTPSTASVTTPSTASVTTPSTASVTTPATAIVTTPSTASVTTPSTVTATTPAMVTGTTPSKATVTTPSTATVTTPAMVTGTTPSTAAVTTPSKATLLTPYTPILPAPYTANGNAATNTTAKGVLSPLGSPAIAKVEPATTPVSTSQILSSQNQSPASSPVSAQSVMETISPAPSTPFVTLQTLVPGTGKEVTKTAAKNMSLPLGSPAIANSEPASAPVWLPQVSAPLSRQQETALPSASMVAETAAPAVILPLPVITPGTNTRPVDSSQPAVEEAPKFRSPSAVEAAVAQNPQVAANYNFAEQTLQSEAARRDANLVAGYLAEATRNEGKSVAGVKTLLAGNGFNLRGDDKERGSDSDLGSQVSALRGEGSFAATVRDLQANGAAQSNGGSSIQSQTISQIIAQAETLPGRQTRSLRLRLRPEELGQIDIQLSRDASGRISAHISAERESARGALSRSLDELRETLSRAGLTVDKLQISTHVGLLAGNRDSNDARSNTGESPTVAANLLTPNETEAGGQKLAEDEKLLSLHA